MKRKVLKQSDVARLSAIRRRLSLLDGAEFHLAYEGGKGGVSASLPDDGPPAMVLNARPAATPSMVEFMACAAADVAFLLDVIDRAGTELRRLNEAVAHVADDDMRRAAAQMTCAPDGEQGRDYAAQAAMLCANNLEFRRFLRGHPGLPVALASGFEDRADPPDQVAAARLRALLRIKSRRELNVSGFAKTRWLCLLAAFEAWKRHGDYGDVKGIAS